MMELVLMTVACAVANRLAGWDKWPGSKVGAFAFVAGLVWGFENDRLISAAIVYAGLLFWRVWGTGNSLAAIHGRRQTYLSWDGKLAYRVTGTDEGKLFGVVAGFFRGSIASIPLFTALAWHSGSWAALAWLPILAGVAWAGCYWLSGAFGERKSSVPVAEILTGACMGALVGSQIP